MQKSYLIYFILLILTTSCKTSKTVQTKDIDGKPFISVQALGAKGDGESNDVQYIQHAFDRYENVFIPKGKYRIAASHRGEHNPRRWH